MLDPARIVATFGRYEVDDVTIGAFAVIAHGYMRADVHLLDIDPTDLDTLANGASFARDTDAGSVTFPAREHREASLRSVRCRTCILGPRVRVGGCAVDGSIADFDAFAPAGPPSRYE